MEPTGTLTVGISGAREGSADATWGQRTIWRWRQLHGDPAHFIMGPVAELPVGSDLAAVTDAIRYVFQRYDALRTLFPVRGDVLRQVVQGSGEAVVSLYEAEQEHAIGTARAISRQLTGVPIDNATEWPVRLALVTVKRSPAFLVFVYDQLALDGHGAAFALGDLRKACTGQAAEMPPRWQPLEEAEYEQSPAGRAVTSRAVEHWQRIFDSAPASIFDFPARPPAAAPFHYQEITSWAVERAARELRKRSRFSLSALVMAAAAVVLGQYTGHEQVTMRLVAGNRFGRDRKVMVGALLSEGAFLLDTGGLSFGGIARAAFRASGAGNQFAFCDPDAVQDALAALGRRRGVHLDLGACFSDVQGGFSEPGSAQAPAAEPDIDEAALLELAGSTVFHESPSSTGLRGLRLLLSAVDPGDGICLRMSCDTRYVPPESMREMLYGIERVLIAAATRDPDAAALRAICQVAPAPRDTSWVRCGSGWVDLPAAEALWRRVAGTADAAVVPEAIPGGNRRLVGCVAAAEPPDLAGLHRAFAAAIGERCDVRAPDVYRWTASVPAPPRDPASWLSLPVLAETAGRPA